MITAWRVPGRLSLGIHLHWAKPRHVDIDIANFRLTIGRVARGGGGGGC